VRLGAKSGGRAALGRGFGMDIGNHARNLSRRCDRGTR
jgi:hypothetical protein